jgi:hypothetical protein
MLAAIVEFLQLHALLGLAHLAHRRSNVLSRHFDRAAWVWQLLAVSALPCQAAVVCLLRDVCWCDAVLMQ